MKAEGPSLEAMMDRVAAIPADFLKDFNKGGAGDSGLNIAALVSDLLVDTGDRPLTPEECKNLDLSTDKKNCLRLISIFCHIYHDNYFIKNTPEPGLIRKFFFSQKIAAIGESVHKADLFITEPDRREEICRLALNVINMYPLGENENRAKERLGTLDSVERKKILDKTRQAQERAREIREAMLRKEAEEAASKMSRE